MKKRLSKIGVVLFALILIGSFIAVTDSLAAAPTKENPIVWKVQTPWPISLWNHKTAEIWGKDIAEMSAGRMKIQLYSAGEIVPAFEIYNAVVRGTLDAGHGWSGYNIGKFPALTLFAATPGFMDVLAYISWLEAGGGKELWQEVYGDSVVVFPSLITWAEGGGWSNKKIEKLSDFKGLKYRTDLDWGRILSEIGASVVTLPAGDIVPSLQRGTLDAAEFSTPSSDLSLGFHEVCKYQYYPGVHQLATFNELIINPKKWTALPDDLKAIVQRAAEASVFRTLGSWALDDAKASQMFREKGVQVKKFSPEMQREILERFVKQYDKNPDKMFQKVWASQKKFLKIYAPYMELQKMDVTIDIK
jgi:TRAP-type mannitol/chloroaromatic compound transport system substrate-binding protein